MHLEIYMFSGEQTYTNVLTPSTDHPDQKLEDQRLQKYFKNKNEKQLTI